MQKYNVTIVNTETVLFHFASAFKRIHLFVALQSKQTTNPFYVRARIQIEQSFA